MLKEKDMDENFIYIMVIIVLNFASKHSFVVLTRNVTKNGLATL